MKIFWLLVPIGLSVLMGCGHENQPGGESAPPVAAASATVGKPGPDTRTSLVLIHNEQSLSLADGVEAVDQVFGKPKGSFEFSDLPADFDSPYTARGWESSREGVGCVLYDKRVVAVVRQLTRREKGDFQQILDTISKANSAITPKTISGKHVNYYFWNDKSQRIMICAMQTKHDGIHITEALGDSVVMDSLGMNESQAAVDEKKVNALFNPAKG